MCPIWWFPDARALGFWVHVERWGIAAAFRMLKSFAVSVPRFLREQVGHLRLQRFGVALAPIRYAQPLMTNDMFQSPEKKQLSVIN